MSDNLPTEREMFEQWAAPILGDNPNWRESGDAELARQAWRAALASRPEPEQQIRLALKMIVSHWDEFGPEHGFDELIDRCARRPLHQNEPVSVHQAKLSDDSPEAVDERQAFETFFATTNVKGRRKLETMFERSLCESWAYADDSTQRHWWTWQNARAAEPKPFRWRAGETRDAERYRKLCQHPDWRFIENLCRQFVADSADAFKAGLDAVVDELPDRPHPFAALRGKPRMNEPTLPDLPQAIGWLGLFEPGGKKQEVYTASQMRAYARAALSDRAVLAGKQYETDSVKLAQRDDPLPAATAGPSEPLITVCDKCLRACCWQGAFMCDDAYGAGTVDKPREELIALGREHSDYWKDSDA